MTVYIYGKRNLLDAAALPAPIVVSVSAIHNWVGGIGNGSQESVAVCYVAHPGIYIVLHFVPAFKLNPGK